ncbi:MAG: hypothetical protein KGI38_00525 [Thaumarchaeota archaeon]|nr:hypothetical protein [Nitrososphaerota archaeon]
MIDSLAWPFIEEGIALTALMGAFFVYVKVSQRKLPPERKRFANLSFLGVTLVLLAVVLMQYTAAVPYQPVSIVTAIVMSAIVFPMYGMIVRYFEIIKLDLTSGKSFLFRALLLLAAYLILFVVTVMGIDFFFTGLVSPQSVPLTPEFEIYGIPTLATLILVLYRVSRHFRSFPFTFMKSIANDVMLLSLTVLLFGFVAEASGVTLTRSPLNLPYDDFAVGILVGLIGIGIESVVLTVQSRIGRLRPGLSLQTMIDQFELQFRSAFSRQKSLDHFFPEEPYTRNSRTDRFFNRIDSKYSIRLKRRTIKASVLLSVGLLVVSILAVFVALTPVSTKILVEGTQVQAELVKMPLPASAQATTSDGIQYPAIDTIYVIPIVTITAGNVSFSAPLSQRYSQLNSSSFVVHDTGTYLQIRLEKVPEIITVGASVLRPLSYNQLNNSAFNYIGVSGDAEIYYALAHDGYLNITAVSASTVQGTDIVAFKDILGTNSQGENVAVAFSSRGGIVSLSEMSITTKDTNISNEIAFLFQQAKIPIDVTITHS